MTVTAAAITFDGGRKRMTWQKVAALGLLVAGAIVAAALRNDVIAATLAGAAAGFAVNREANGNGHALPPPPSTRRRTPVQIEGGRHP